MTSPTTHQQAGSTGQGSDLRQAAGEEAQHLGAEGMEASRDVARTAREEAAGVGDEVRVQTRRLVQETRDQLTNQATQRRDSAVGGLRSMGDELRTMARHEGSSGWATQLARQGAEWSDRAAEYLQSREPGQLVDDLRDLARRRPGTFLLGAAIAGAVTGRLVRAMTSEKFGSTSEGPSGTTGSMDQGTAEPMYEGVGAAGSSYVAAGTDGPSYPTTGTAGPPYEVQPGDIARAGTTTASTPPSGSEPMMGGNGFTGDETAEPPRTETDRP